MYLRALVWKDFRNQQRFLIAAGVFLLMPHLIAAAALLVNQLGKHPVHDDELAVFFWAACLADLGIVALLSPFMAGNAIAGERADRSAEFTAYLPIPRKDAITSKIIVTLGVCIGMLAVCAGVALFVQGILPVHANAPEPLPELRPYVATIVLGFGVAWLASSMVRSAAYAAAAGIVLPISIGVTLSVLGEMESLRTADMLTAYVVACWVIGPASFIAGIVYYLRRIEA